MQEYIYIYISVGENLQNACVFTSFIGIFWRISKRMITFSNNKTTYSLCLYSPNSSLDTIFQLNTQMRVYIWIKS